MEVQELLNSFLNKVSCIFEVWVIMFSIYLKSLTFISKTTDRGVRKIYQAIFLLKLEILVS